jgi:hypothetical protein
LVGRAAGGCPSLAGQAARGCPSLAGQAARGCPSLAGRAAQGRSALVQSVGLAVRSVALAAWLAYQQACRCNQ